LICAGRPSRFSPVGDNSSRNRGGRRALSLPKPPGIKQNFRELIRTAEDIDADAIIGVDYQNGGAVRIDETGVKLKCVVATGIAVKVTCAA
jgi:hypothetical protein